MSVRNSLVVSVLLFGTAGIRADVLRLKSGVNVQGTLVRATSSTIEFSGVNGGSKTYGVSDVDAIQFAPLPPPPRVSAAAAPPSAGPPGIVVPAGTEITVRLIDSIQGSSSAVGQRYQASVDDPVMIGSQTALPRGANCTVQIVAMESGEGVNLKLYDVSLGGKNFATVSDYAEVKATGTSKGKKAARRGVGLGAIGAGIGAIAGGGQGAAIGAVVGGGVGAISGAAAKGKQINVPSETRLAFRLKSPLPLD